MRVDGAPSLPIKDEVDLAIDARAREIMMEYDVSEEEAMQMARGDVMRSMDETGVASPQAALARQHQEAGASPASAARLAANQVRAYGPEQALRLSQEYATPEGQARLQQAQAENAAADKRHRQMQDDYFRDTGAPGHVRPSPELQRQWDDSDRYYGEQRRVIRAGLHSQQPVDPGTPEQGARWEAFLQNNPDEMARYRPEEAAKRQKADDSKAWADKRALLVKRYGEEEVQKMEAARQRGAVYVPNTQEQREGIQRHEDLVTASMHGSTDARRQLAAMDRNRHAQVARPRQLRELGMTPEEAKGMSDERIRILLREKREEEKQAKDLLWRPRTMIQAGNAIGALALPGMDDWQLSAIRGGPTPLDVEARQAAMAADMARQAVTGFLANTPQAMTPAQQQMADLKGRQEEENLPPDAAAARERDRNDGVLPASSRAGQRVLQQIDDEFIGPYAVGSEVDAAVEAAVARGVPRAEAEAYFAPRRRNWSEWMGGGSPGAAPAPASGRPAANPWATGGV